MPERGRRIMSFVLAALAVFSVGRVLVAYARRPSRWSTRFALPADDRAEDLEVMDDLRHERASKCPATGDDFAVLARYRAEMVSAIIKGDSRAYARNFSANCVTLTVTGSAIVGNVALTEAVSGTLAKAEVFKAVVEVTNRRALGAGVFEEGYFDVQLRIGEADVLSKGRFAALWKREMGEWRIVFEAVRADGNETVET